MGLAIAVHWKFLAEWEGDRSSFTAGATRFADWTLAGRFEPVEELFSWVGLLLISACFAENQHQSCQASSLCSDVAFPLEYYQPCWDELLPILRSLSALTLPASHRKDFSE